MGLWTGPQAYSPHPPRRTRFLQNRTLVSVHTFAPHTSSLQSYSCLCRCTCSSTRLYVSKLLVLVRAPAPTCCCSSCAGHHEHATPAVAACSTRPLHCCRCLHPQPLRHRCHLHPPCALCCRCRRRRRTQPTICATAPPPVLCIVIAAPSPSSLCCKSRSGCYTC